MTSTALPRLDIPAQKGVWRLVQRLKGAARRRKTAATLLGLVVNPAYTDAVRSRMRTLVDLGLWNDGLTDQAKQDEARWLGHQLFYVARAGHSDLAIVHMAFEAGVPVDWTQNNQRDDNWTTIFARTGQADCLMVAIAAGADARYCDSCNESALHLLLKRACNSELKRERTQTLEAIDRLLQSGYDINETGQNEHRFGGGGPPLRVAVEAMDLDLTRWMVERGARVDLADDRGELPAHWAATTQGFSLDEIKTTKMLDYLASRGAAIDTPNPRGETPLWRSMAWRAWHQARWFMEQGADLTARPHTYQDGQGYEKPGVPGYTLLTQLARHLPPGDAFSRDMLQRILLVDPDAWQASMPEGGTLAQSMAKSGGPWQAMLEQDQFERTVAEAPSGPRKGPRL